MKQPLSFLLLVLLTACASNRAHIPTTPDEADRSFREGDFAGAQLAYIRATRRDPRHFQSALRLGEIALLRNDLRGAVTWASRAAELEPDDKNAMRVLAYAHYRSDDFRRAAPFFRKLENEAVAKKLESFGDTQPYAVEGAAALTRIPFIQTDPLPLLDVRVNGSDPVHFLIDTGGSEVILDTEFAARVKAERFGSVTGTFGGGKTAETEQGRVDAITLGEFVIRNVPVHILSTRRFVAAAQGKQVDGILGTSMLAHFLSTIDYRKGELVLRRKGTPLEGTEAATIPFWMARDHFMVARGSVNGSKPLLWFLDTGLAGGGFVCPESTLKDGQIKLPDREAEGIGGGGAMKLVSFVVDKLTLGPIERTNVVSFFGPFPPSLENSEGFRIAGIVSHTFFRPYALSFDFDHMRLLLEK